MDRSGCTRWLPVVVAITGVLNAFGSSWVVTGANDPLVTSQQTPKPMPHQYTGLNRAGTGVALILGCLIVPAGLIGILVLVIRKCVTFCIEMRKSKTKNTPIFEDPRERTKWQSEMLLYVDGQSEKARNSDEEICLEDSIV